MKTALLGIAIILLFVPVADAWPHHHDHVIVIGPGAERRGYYPCGGANGPCVIGSSPTVIAAPPTVVIQPSPVVVQQPSTPIFQCTYMGDPRYTPPCATAGQGRSQTQQGQIQIAPQPMQPQVAPEVVPVRRVQIDINTLWKHREVRNIYGTPLTPDLPEDGAVMVCTAESGQYPRPDGGKYNHKQRCWVYEHPQSSEIISWEYIRR